MPNIEVALPAGVSEGVHIRAGDLTGQTALVIGWRLTRLRFLVGGSLDGAPQLAIQVITDQGEESWLQATEIAGVGDPVHTSVSLPFIGGDEVIIHPSRAAGEIRGWEIIGRRLETSVIYRVHVQGTPRWDVIEVDAHDLEPRLRSA